MLLACACDGTPASDPIASGNASSKAPQAAPAPATAALDQDVAETVDQILTSAVHPGLRWGKIPDAVPALKALYDEEPDRLLWFDGAKPSPALEPTLATIAAAGDHGLDAGDYDAATLVEQWSQQRKSAWAPADRALFDVGVSVAAVRMLKAVFVGRVDPATIYWGYDVKTKKADFTALLREVRSGKSLATTLDALSPQVTHYARARRTLADYKKLAAAGEPARVPELPKGRSKVAAGQSWDGIADLAARLRTVGDLATDVSVAGDVYSAPLVAAVKRFQERHGLDADGTIGAGTIGVLNITLAERVRQIELAMERMRWLPVLSEQPNVFVNLPLFRMWATDPTTGDEPLRMNVVVGKSLGHQTPIFVEKMEYVIFRPYWTPPHGIAVKEIVPHIRRDPSYFDKEDLEIVASGEDSAPTFEPTPENLSKVVAGRLHIRQRPGPKNSLGLAKFIFPNADDVYMHGTPAQQLFSRARRDFSHGCIRLEDPARFAEWVLRDQPEWTREKIDTAMQGAKPLRVNLKQPLTVVLFYDTVHVNSEGVVFFVRDIYDDDRELDVALKRGYPYPVKN